MKRSEKMPTEARGRPSVLLVEDEEARADILKKPGIDLSRSPV